MPSTTNNSPMDRLNQPLPSDTLLNFEVNFSPSNAMSNNTKHKPKVYASK